MSEPRRCDFPGCGKILAALNKKKRCFFHQLPAAKQKEMNERPRMGNAPLCSSRETTGITIVRIDYEGTAKDL